MSALSKRQRLINEQVQGSKEYSVTDAIQLLKALPPVKFVESVEASVRLNINPKKSDQVMRGVVVLPHGTGRTARVIVISEMKEQLEAAVAQGAHRAGFEDLINEIKQGNFALSERDTIIATPAAMPSVMPLGPILGPKGLMPNPKLGTVTEDTTTAVKEALSGRVQYRSDKGGVIRCLVGKLSFSPESLQENLNFLLANLIKTKPESAPQGKSFVKKVALCSTMGPELCISQDSLNIHTAI